MAKKQPAAQSSMDLRTEAHTVASSRQEILKAHTFTARATSAVAPAPDEADNMWQGVGAIVPPYEPFVLMTLLEHSNSLRQCIDAYVTNIDACGHRFEPIIDLNASDANDRIKTYLLERRAEKQPEVVADGNVQLADPTEDEIGACKKELAEKMRQELLRVKHFFEYACLDQSFVALRKQTRQDVEQAGNGYWEIIKEETGAIAGFSYIPGFTMRHMPADIVPTPVNVKIKRNEFDWTTVGTHRFFRRFVQVFESRVIFFKEFGDPRTVSRKTGAYFDNVEALLKQDPTDAVASEVMHFSIHASKSSYGIPRWIGCILSVLGSRQAEEVNLSYFENKSVPPLAILVSGGKISNETVKRIQDFIENDIKGKKNFHKILVLEAESPGTSGFDQGRMKLEMKPLTAAQHNDALFQDYDQNNMDKVGMAFRLPRMLRGDIRDFNRATADAAIDFSEQQVFKPERDGFDFAMNRKILPLLGVKFWTFKSNGAGAQNAKDLSDMLTELCDKAVLTPSEAREFAQAIFNRPLAHINEPWAHQPIALTLAGIVPPDKLLAPGMVTPQAAATGQTTPGTAGGVAPDVAPAPAADVQAVKLTGTDLASIITVNEARKQAGLGNLQMREGGDDPDGFLTVAEFKAKKTASGTVVGQSEGGAEPETAKDDGGYGGATSTSDLAAGGLLGAGQQLGRRRRQGEEKGSVMESLRELLTLRKALDMIDQQDAEAAFNKAKALGD